LVEKGGRKKVRNREEAPENDKESSHSAHVNGMNKLMNKFMYFNNQTF